MKESPILAKIVVNLLLMFSVSLLSSCSDVYYTAMEKFGYSKRDILVDRVEKTQEAQSEAQEEFKSALEQFFLVVKVENSNLKETYLNLNAEYEACLAAAEAVALRIENVESVSKDLFSEWSKELEMYQNQSLQLSSRQRLQDAWGKYNEMLSSMHQANESMTAVLFTFRDNVLFLKHNLNAQAIGALKNEFSVLKIEIDRLVLRMNSSIEKSNTFIDELKNTNKRLRYQ
ncbi:MAG: DUF2959 domain-containing protein [Desulfobulbaceae bacterium]|nr:MAG: DUF2959 domain-containing protein [Desulfobulbaceae bacterium]